MKHSIRITSYMLALFTSVVFSSCYTEDPGRMQEADQEFTVVDFDRLEMGDAFIVTVTQGSLFEVKTNGDYRNLDDLVVEKEGSTLVIRYREHRERRHATRIRITMPTLLGAHFSGASDSKISGFHDLDDFAINLTGASTCQLDITSKRVDAILSGASYLYMYGEGETIDADLSGASVLKAFQYPVRDVSIRASGASDGNINVSERLNARASGASLILYRGDPAVESEVSGASTVRKD